MTFRIALLILLAGVFAGLLSSCNLTLAEDVTPTPDYVPPSPLPTSLGGMHTRFYKGKIENAEDSKKTFNRTLE